MPPEIKTIAVIGAGSAGRTIALACASAGYRTVLEDVYRPRLEDAVRWIDQSLREMPKHGANFADDHTISWITAASSVEDAIRDADLILEAAPEEMEMKMELFTIFDKFARPAAIFASNTSSLSISDMSDLTVVRERCIGMHFADFQGEALPIELVITPFTSSGTVEACTGVARCLGRSVVIVKESDRVVAPARGAS